MLSNFWGEGSFDDPRFGSFTLIQQMINIKKNATDGTNYREFIDLIIPFSKCKVGINFFYHDAEEVE